MAFAASLQADPINGTTGFTGAFSAANNDLTTPNDVITITSASVNGTPTGSFVGGVLTHFTSPITLNDTLLSGAPSFSQPLWQITVGLHVYTFTSTSDSTILDTANVNTIQGTGTVTDSLDGDTAFGTYNLSFNVTTVGTDVTLTWNGTTGAATLPDGGTTGILLGAALAGLGIIRRKLA